MKTVEKTGEEIDVFWAAELEVNSAEMVDSINMQYICVKACWQDLYYN